MFQIIVRVFLRVFFAMGIAFMSALYAQSRAFGWWLALALLIIGSFGWEEHKKRSIVMKKTINAIDDKSFTAHLLKNKDKIAKNIRRKK